MLKHYVSFLHPNIMVDDETTKEITERYPHLDVPDDSYGFYFWDREEGEIGGVEVKSAPINRSGTYFYGGRVLTVDDVKRDYLDKHILVDNMVKNHWDRVILVRNQWAFRLFRDEDVLLAPK